MRKPSVTTVIAVSGSSCVLFPLISAEVAALPPTVVVTAARDAVEQQDTAASVTVIDAERAQRLGEPLVVSLLRQAPATNVASGGPAGSITEVRIRGAEANHTLLFVDGIRVNDPAAGNIPRFELLGADLADRLEIVRGPQSALWGSEAIGGVVALTSQQSAPAFLAVEAGSLGFSRVSGRAGVQHGAVQASFGGGYQRADGIDSFGEDGGDRDGYNNLSLRGRVAWRPSSALEMSISSFAVHGRSEYDGYRSFVRADTEDTTSNRLHALGGNIRWQGLGWTITANASRLRSRNRNRLDDEFVNQTSGGRGSLGVQVERALRTGAIDHELIIAGELDRERFGARDEVYSGATNQARTRKHRAVTGEWRAAWGPVSTDLAVRRDSFSAFKDATTVRAAAVLDLSGRWSLTGGYATGIAQPTFFDLYGFFPDSFIGNSKLVPEHSSGWEAGLRFRSGGLNASAVLFRQRLRDEIVEQYSADFRSTVVNAAGTSRRSGLEAAAEWQVGPALRLSGSYAMLLASESGAPGDKAVRESRRPRHSGSLALDGQLGRWSYGASASYVGKRRDTDFDSFPARIVRLDRYWLAGGRLAYALNSRVQLFGRVANAFDADYQDVIGYRTEGRSVYAGLRLGLGS